MNEIVVTMIKSGDNNEIWWRKGRDEEDDTVNEMLVMMKSGDNGGFCGGEKQVEEDDGKMST